MDERKNQAPDLARAEPLGPALLRWSRWLPLPIFATMALLAWLVILQESRAVSLLKERIQEENRLRMLSSQEHISEYLEEVYSILLFMSQNEDVMAMRGQARGFIQKLYDHGWENHQLAEVYVVERDFRGDRRPFMTFGQRAGELVAAADSRSRARAGGVSRPNGADPALFGPTRLAGTLESRNHSLRAGCSRRKVARLCLFGPHSGGGPAGRHRRRHDPDPHHPGAPAPGP